VSLRVVDGGPPVRKFAGLYKTTGWHPQSLSIMQRALDNSLAVVCAYDSGELIGVARAVGDGAMYVYIQDVIVHPGRRREGIGEKMVKRLIAVLEHAGVSAIGLFCAAGALDFWLEMGFRPRPIEAPGMFRVLPDE
jgi:GNAT superfamily N-acetyltransferase